MPTMTIALADAGQHVVQVVVGLLQLAHAVLQLVVDGGQLLVGRLQLLLRGLELLVGALQLFVRRLQLLVRRLELLVGALQLLDRALQVLLGHEQLALELLRALVLGRSPLAGGAARPAAGSSRRGFGSWNSTRKQRRLASPARRSAPPRSRPARVLAVLGQPCTRPLTRSFFALRARAARGAARRAARAAPGAGC